MPHGTLIAVWQGCVWVVKGDRIYYSWPGHGEYWSDENFFPVDEGTNGDRITAIMPHGERLLVFKRNGVWAVHGYDPDSFQLVPLSKSSGAVSQEAVCTAGFDVFFVDWPNGVYHIPYQSVPTLISAKIAPVFEDGRIPQDERTNIYCGWAGRKVWVGVPWGDAEHGRTFAYDPALESWTAYSVNVKYAQDVYPSNETNYAFGVVTHSSAPTTGKLAQLDATADQDLGSYHIPAQYQTRWFAKDDPLAKARFLRPGFVFAASVLQVTAYLDYQSTAHKHFQLTGTTTPASGVWGEDWGSMVWTAGAGRDDLVVDNGKRIGNGKALSLLISDPNDEDWSVSAVVFKFTPRRRNN